jgi:hypothetical protein
MLCFTVVAPFFLGAWFLVVKRCEKKHTSSSIPLWILCSFPESVVIAIYLATWISGFVCFNQNCMMDGCPGYDTYVIIWTVTISVSTFVFFPLRYSGLLYGIFTPPETKEKKPEQAGLLAKVAAAALGAPPGSSRRPFIGIVTGRNSSRPGVIGSSRAGVGSVALS